MLCKQILLSGEKSLLVRLGSSQEETIDNRVHRAIFINVFGDMLHNTDIKHCHKLVQTGFVLIQMSARCCSCIIELFDF